jgi:di/tricarboxylate transporter
MLDPILITIIILACAAVLLLSNLVRADVVAVLVALALGLSGVLTPQEAFAGFSRSASITIIAVFILAEGLQRTGLTDLAGQALIRLVGHQERWLAVGSMLAASMLSLVMNNIAAASVILPVVSGAARRIKANPSKLLMPMAFGTILGGMATLLTTTNIVVSGLLKEQGLAGFGLLDFAPIGIPIVIVGILYMTTIGYRLLPNKPPQHISDDEAEQRLLNIYRMEERLIHCRVRADSILIGQTLAESNLRGNLNLNVIAIQRNKRPILSPQPNLELAAGDVLIMAGRLEDLPVEITNSMFDILPAGHWPENGELGSEDVTVVEALLAPRSGLIAQSLRSAHFREKYKMNVLGIYRAGRPIRTHLSELTLEFGDALLLQGPRDQIRILRSEPDLIILYADASSEPVPDRRKAPLALAILVITLLVSLPGQSAIQLVMLAGAILMVLTKVLTMDQAYQAVEWRTVFLVAGMLPLGTAITKSGAADRLAESLVQIVGPYGPIVLLASLMIFSIALTLVMHGAVAATIAAPIAIQLARNIGVDPHAMAMGVALATSMAFITPLGHPVNILVMSSGGYEFKHFIKIGLPLTVILVTLILLLLPLVFPLIPTAK